MQSVTLTSMKEIPLYKGYANNRRIVAYAKVDDEDFEEMSKGRWCLNGRYPERFRKPEAGSTRRTERMHNVIMGGLRVDHIDRDRLNNQRSNLRWASHAENRQNSPCRKDSATGVKNVHWVERKKRYKVQVVVNYVRYNGGMHKTLEEADAAAKALRAKVQPFSQEALGQ